MTIQLDALGETGPFQGFVDADFDAFERKKWSSRKFTLERRAARQKLVAIAREVLTQEATWREVVELGASDDAPSVANGRKVDGVWAFLTRPAPLRKALASRLSKTNLSDTTELFDIAVEHQHASLLFYLDLEGVRIEVLFSPRARVDRVNARTKLGYQQDREELLRLCQALPENAQVGFGLDLVPAQSLGLDTVEKWAAAFGEGPDPFSARFSWARSEPPLRGVDFLPLAHSVAVPLLELRAHLAWSRDNDFAQVGVAQTLERAEKKLKKNAVVPEDTTLAPGTRVTILSGLFAGRAGYLAEPDTKGHVKVMVGPVSVSVPVQDLKVS